MYKGLCKSLRSSYDPSFVYKLGKWNEHPDPDRASKEACGRGLHLCRRIIDIPEYVNGVAHVAQAYYREKLGEDDKKIRVSAILLTRPVDWAKLKPLYDEYWAKLKPLYDEYGAKRKLLDDEYWAKRKPLYDEYGAKRKLLYDEYEAKLKPLDDEYEAKLKPLYDEYGAKRKPLDDEYEAKLRRKFREEAHLV